MARVKGSWNREQVRACSNKVLEAGCTIHCKVLEVHGERQSCMNRWGRNVSWRRSSECVLDCEDLRRDHCMDQVGEVRSARLHLLEFLDERGTFSVSLTPFLTPDHLHLVV